MEPIIIVFGIALLMVSVHMEPWGSGIVYIPGVLIAIALMIAGVLIPTSLFDLAVKTVIDHVLC